MGRSNKCAPATKHELDWIAEFQKLAKRRPKKLWLFSASGLLCVMKYPENGDVSTGDRYGGVNQENLIDTIDIPNDGGDW